MKKLDIERLEESRGRREVKQSPTDYADLQDYSIPA